VRQRGTRCYEAGDGLRVALDLLLECQEAVDLVVEGLEEGAHLAAELGDVE